MTALATAINSTVELITLDEALPAGTRYLRIDDELIEVAEPFGPGFRNNQREDPDPLRVAVLRGREGSTATSHLAAAEVTIQADAFVPDLPFSGGLQTVRLLEFPFAYDDAFVNNDYAVAATVPNDGYVIYSAIIVSEDWAGSGVSATEATFECVKNPTGAPDMIVEYDGIGTENLAGGPSEFSTLITSRNVVPVAADDEIGVAVWPGDGALSAGAATLVVLIVEPA